MHVISATGHRPDRLGGYRHWQAEPLIVLAADTLVAMRPDYVWTGGAQGWDQCVGWACVRLGIPFGVIVPGMARPHGGNWPPAARAEYERLLALAADVEQRPFAGAFQEYRDRDEQLVERADWMLALWSGVPSGTGITVRMAHERHVPVWNVWKESGL